MPHSNNAKKHHHGGLRRTIICRCGKSIRGHPDQLCGIIKAHGHSCEHAPELLREHLANPHAGSMANSFEADSRRGDIRVATGHDDTGNTFQLTRIAGTSKEWDTKTKKDLETRLRELSKKKKPPTGKQKREMKKQGIPLDTHIFSEVEKGDIAQLCDDIVAEGYEIKLYHFWKRSHAPMLTTDWNIFQDIRSGGKSIAETDSVEEISKRLDVLIGLLNSYDFEGESVPVSSLPPEYLLYNTQMYMNVYAYSWKTGISNDDIGICATFINLSKPTILCVQEVY